MGNDEDKYQDIINLPRHVSKTRPKMEISDRAAQFAPFSALTGYESAINETARYTDTKIIIDEETQNIVNLKQRLLKERISEGFEVSITYFKKDEKKDGGMYVKISGTVKKIDEYKKIILLTDGRKIPIEDIFEIESDLFNKYF